MNKPYKQNDCKHGLLYKQYVVKKMHKPYTNDALWQHDVGIYQGVKLPMERSSDYFV